jgi:tRNA(Ile2) C34 agmatinyltransferase TiaS
MSEIPGTGYGTSHDWRRAASTWGGQITYRCRRCGAAFNFDPMKNPNIPRTLELSGVPDKCERRAT